jgi:aspartate beta-hydroxylase
MSPFARNLPLRRAVVDVMRQGGYFDRIMGAGTELDRVKEFLRRMEDLAHVDPRPMQHPTFLPIFPGLDNRPVRTAAGDPIARYLEEALPQIQAAAARLRERTLSFSGGVVTDGSWSIYPLWYMGLSLPFMTMHCPELKRIAAELPNSGMKHPFSEALLSWQAPRTHLGAHCSVDTLRLRYSLGVMVEDRCELRVADQINSWRAGESVIFEDCFEHEAWNGPKSRLVFIIDTWHPDLTDVERDALMAGFRKREIRNILYEFRLSEQMRGFLRQRFVEEDADPLFDRYWDRSAAIVSPTISDWGAWNTVPVFGGEANAASARSRSADAA